MCNKNIEQIINCDKCNGLGTENLTDGMHICQGCFGSGKKALLKDGTIVSVHYNADDDTWSTEE